MPLTARDDGRVTMHPGMRVGPAAGTPGRRRPRTGPASLPPPRWSAGPVAASVLAAALLAGCSGGQAAGGPAGTATAGNRPAPAGPGASASVSPGGPGTAGAAGPGTAAAGGTTGTAGPGTQAGCTAWPAGSTKTTLLITSGSNGKSYCVRTGQTVQVFLSGTLSLADGSEPPRLTGNALAVAPARQPQVLRTPSVSYLAVRPGAAVLTIVRLPCHSIRPMQTGPADGAAGTGALAPAASGPAEETAYTAPQGAAAGTAGGSDTGGAPVGAQCAMRQALRVTVTVT